MRKKTINDSVIVHDYFSETRGRILRHDTAGIGKSAKSGNFGFNFLDEFFGAATGLPAWIY